MSFIAHLATSSPEVRDAEIKAKILEAQKILLEDQSRTSLLDEDDLDSFDDIDEIILESVHIDEAKRECIALFAWSSFGPKEEDDERSVHGNATVHLIEDATVSFSDATAALDGTDGRRRRDTEDPSEMDEDEQQRRQDEDDYCENVTKDW